MARSGKLKVYRAPIGFHDVYVAAPSQKAALAAWGSEHDLFARGIAELVTDPALIEEPLSKPGEIVRRSRGTAAEQLAALPPAKPQKRKAASAQSEKRPPPQRKVKPRPSRDELDAAELAIAEAGNRRQAALQEVKKRETALAQERQRVERSSADEIAKLRKACDRAAAAYERAMSGWRA